MMTNRSFPLELQRFLLFLTSHLTARPQRFLKIRTKNQAEHGDWQTQKNPEIKKDRFSQRERSVFYISGHGKQRESIFSRMRLNSIGSIWFYRFYAERSNNSSRDLIARRLCSIWL